MKSSISFKNKDLKVAANIFLPQDFNEKNVYPVIVVAHPAGGVKEQTSGLYAERMAKHGYITMAYDATYQGASEGTPRGLEDPASRVEDIRAAIDYLTTLPYIDQERIGMMGICAGGGYAVAATQTDHRIKAVAGVSSVDIGENSRKGWTGDSPVSEAISLLEKIGEQRIREAGGAETMYISWTPAELNENDSKEWQDAYKYYRTSRGQHPNSTGNVVFTSFANILAFSAFGNLETLLTQPILLIAGSEAGTRWNSENAVKRINGTKELVILDGANHFDLYDIPHYVDQAEEKLVEFFDKHLQNVNQNEAIALENL
jgi:fermentation-respiration switch protein FrsA (DUF1100 family)